MEAIQLLSFILASVIVSLAHYHRRRRSTTARSLRQQPTIKIRDAAVARQALIEQADTFSNRPATPFAVPLITDRRRRRQSHGLTTVPYGPHWRALRSSVTAALLQPWRQGLLGPLQQDAVEALVAGLGAGGDVVIRDRLYPAVFDMLVRVLFGDDVDAHHVRSIEHMMIEFREAIDEARVFARSTMARLWQWRKLRRFLGFRTQQAALFAPLIEAARQRRRRQKTGPPQHGAGGRRPYVDSLIDNRSIPDEDDPGAKRALTEGEMVSLLVEFLGAAEAVISALEWTLAHLVNQPEVQAKLRRELIAGKNHGGNDDGSIVSDSGDMCSAVGRSTTYLHAVVLEGLRLHPPFPLATREVRSEGTVVGTETVPAGGMQVKFVLGDIGRDEKMWTDPSEFRPERFLAGGEGEGVGPVPAGPKEIKMMPFGAGQRACPGAAMAVQFIEGFLAALVREFEWEAPGTGGAVDMTELYGFIRMMKSPLRALITPCA